MAMKFVLDTSAYSGFNRGNNKLRKYFSVENEILVPLIVVGELRAGFAAGTKRSENELLLRRFLDAPNVLTISLSDATTVAFANIFLQLRKLGTPIGANDLWIAALSLEHEVPILTTDSDFSKVNNLSVIRL